MRTKGLNITISISYFPSQFARADSIAAASGRAAAHAPARIRPGLSTPAGSSAAFTRRPMAASGAGSSGSTATAARQEFRGAEQGEGAVPGCRGGGDHGGVRPGGGRAGDPDQPAARVEQHAPEAAGRGVAAPQHRRRHARPSGRAHGHAPHRVARLRAERLGVAHPAPQVAAFRVLDQCRLAEGRELVPQPARAIGRDSAKSSMRRMASGPATTPFPPGSSAAPDTP